MRGIRDKFVATHHIAINHVDDGEFLIMLLLQTAQHNDEVERARSPTHRFIVHCYRGESVAFGAQGGSGRAVLVKTLHMGCLRTSRSATLRNCVAHHGAVRRPTSPAVRHMYRTAIYPYWAAKRAMQRRAPRFMCRPTTSSKAQTNPFTTFTCTLTGTAGIAQIASPRPYKSDN